MPNSEEEMEMELKMTKPFLVFTLLVIVGLLTGLLASLKHSSTLETEVENLLAKLQTFETKSSK